MKTVRQAWQKLSEEVPCSSDIWETHGEEVFSRYSEKGRHYHNLSHISQMLQTAEEYPTKIEDYRDFRLAIFYHDLIYSATRKDNELKSAEIAKERSLEIGLRPDRAENIFQLIMATRHQEDPKSNDSKYLVDIDLQILGESPGVYHIYTRKIRKEYAIYPGFLYRKGRKKVLGAFLEKNRIYHTPEFFEKYEVQARKNLENEWASL